ncbi:MAG: D-alanyl-D-alanine carboxypeptidase family protein [Minisyncoccia bacterium]
MNPNLSTYYSWAVSFIAALLVAGLGYGGYRYYLLTGELTSTHQQAVELQSSLASTTDQNRLLSEALVAEKNRNDSLASEVDSIQDKVSDLNKLAKIDPQLLVKYSKVYFLNENYVPKDLATIDEKYLYQDKEKLQILDQVEPYLKEMFDDMEDDDVSIQILSAYRSFDTQATLKSGYRVTYGSGANAFSADQGYSEHQLGTAIDFTTPTIGAILTGFDKTEAYTWLTKNAYRYGFILSYPANNAYYIFEPWHWRFVGTDLARELHRNKQYFYQMDQRDINTYLISIFD